MGSGPVARVKKVLRSLQTFFPAAQEFRTYVEHIYRTTVPTSYETGYRGFTLLNLGDGPMLDIGANRGQSIDAFRNILRGREIISFEPNPVRFEALKRMFRNSRGVQILPHALSDSVGEATLYAPRYRRWIFDGLASMNRENAMGWLRPETFAWFNPKLLTCVELKINSIRLDSLDLAPAAMKIDTEGHELFVMRGAMETIRRHLPAILLERPAAEVFELLEPLGYLAFSFENGALHESRTAGADTYFVMPHHLRAAAIAA